MVDRMGSGWGKWNQWCLGIHRTLGSSALGLMLGLSGCGGTVVEETDGTDGTGTTGGGADVPEDCIGGYAGSFDGDIRGSLTGSLDANADFVVTFALSGNGQTVTGSGSVDKDGGIEVLLGPNSVTGRFDFTRCRATGDWVMGEARGAWKAKLH